MSGVKAIRYLLANHALLTNIVPASRIKPGKLRLSTPLPAISVMQISSVPYNTIRTNESKKMHTDRVQVTVLVKEEDGSGNDGYPSLRSILLLVLAACPSQRGKVSGVSVLSIQPEAEGPDFADDSLNALAGSRDFLVKWTGA